MQLHRVFVFLNSVCCRTW